MKELIAALQLQRNQSPPDANHISIPAHLVDEVIAALSDLYSLGLVTEEAGEVLQLIGKWLRFGPDHARRDGETARGLLPTEVGDLSAAIDFMCLDGITPFNAVISRREEKKAKLLNADSRDDQGRRLAPEPRFRPMVCGYCSATVYGGPVVMRQHVQQNHNGG